MSGHPQRHRAIRGLSALAVAAVVLVGAGCGQALDRETAVERFRAANPEVDAERAACVVDRLIDRYGLDGLADELEADEPDPEFVEIQFRELFTCGFDGDIEAQIADQLHSSGVDEADVPCVTEALVDDLTGPDLDVLLSGEITDEFLAKFIDAMDGCGAIDS